MIRIANFFAVMPGTFEQKNFQKNKKSTSKKFHFEFLVVVFLYQKFFWASQSGDMR